MQNNIQSIQQQQQMLQQQQQQQQMLQQQRMLQQQQGAPPGGMGMMMGVPGMGMKGVPMMMGVPGMPQMLGGSSASSTANPPANPMGVSPQNPAMAKVAANPAAMGGKGMQVPLMQPNPAVNINMPNMPRPPLMQQADVMQMQSILNNPQLAASNPQMVQMMKMQQQMMAAANVAANNAMQAQLQRQRVAVGGVPVLPAAREQTPEEALAEEKLKRDLMQRQAMIKKKELEQMREAAKKEKLNNIKTCHLHKKPNPKKCKFCKRYEDELAKANQEVQELEKRTDQAARQLGISLTSKLDGAQEYTNSQTYNMSVLLKDQIVKSPFFKSLAKLDAAGEQNNPEAAGEQNNPVYVFIEEAAVKVDNCEIYMQGSIVDPSTFICCLLRLLVLRPNTKQLKYIINYKNSPYVRMLGFLLMRFVFDFERMWKWYESYLLDQEVIKGVHGEHITIGESIERLLMEDKYGEDCVLPRVANVNRLKKANVLCKLDEMRERAYLNSKIFDEKFKAGTKVEGCSFGS